jgi:hypothetical protein
MPPPPSCLENLCRGSSFSCAVPIKISRQHIESREELMELTKAKEKAEDLVVQLRELVGLMRKSFPTAERETQKEQLKVIGTSIQHLEKKNVSVPEDLRRLQSKLEIEIQEGEKYQVLFLFLREQLSRLLSEIGTTPRKGQQDGIAQKETL